MTCCDHSPPTRRRSCCWLTGTPASTGIRRLAPMSAMACGSGGGLTSVTTRSGRFDRGRMVPQQGWICCASGRGKGPCGNKCANHGRRGARPARREERADRAYVSDEQRSPAGCIGGQDGARISVRALTSAGCSRQSPQLVSQPRSHEECEAREEEKHFVVRSLDPPAGGEYFLFLAHRQAAVAFRAAGGPAVLKTP